MRIKGKRFFIVVPIVLAWSSQQKLLLNIDFGNDTKSSLLNLLGNTVQISSSRPLISHETLFKSECNDLYGNIPAVQFLIMCMVQSS